jgi:ABC-type Zn2+ transport system substrate-binding protein/surface adhesin
MLPEEIKHRSLRAIAESAACPNEVEEKHMLESDKLKAVTNLEKYQEEMRAWRDLKVKLKQFEDGNLVLLRSPHTENTRMFEAKWTWPYVISEKMRPGAYRLSNTQGRVLEHSWNT